MSGNHEEGNISQNSTFIKDEGETLDSTFINKITALVRQSMEPEVSLMRLPPCAQYSKEEAQRYLQGDMSVELESAFEAHCLECLACANNLVREQENFMIILEAAEKREDERLYAKAMYILDELDRKKEETNKQDAGLLAQKIFHIVLGFAEDMMQIIQTSGALLNIPAPVMAVRGETMATGGGPPLQIVQDFVADGLSVQATIFRTDPLGVRLHLSLYDTVAEVFIPGVEMIVRKVGQVIQQEVSNDAGEGVFDLPVDGRYVVDLVRETGQIGEIHLDMEN